MSRLKFRFWDEELNKMIYNIYVSDQAIIIPNNKNPLHKEHFTDCRIINPRLAQKHLMQCTGLKDINGDLIWEGDVLKNMDGDISKILFSEEQAEFVRINNGHYELRFSQYKIESISLEKIGNIYENPELLKEVTNE